jgi:hypothetical protein
VEAREVVNRDDVRGVIYRRNGASGFSAHRSH